MVTKLGPNQLSCKSTKALFGRYWGVRLSRFQVKATPARKSLKTRCKAATGENRKASCVGHKQCSTQSAMGAFAGSEILTPPPEYPTCSEIVTAFSHWARVSMILINLGNLTRDWQEIVRLLCWLLLQVK